MYHYFSMKSKLWGEQSGHNLQSDILFFFREMGKGRKEHQIHLLHKSSAHNQESQLLPRWLFKKESLSPVVIDYMIGYLTSAAISNKKRGSCIACVASIHV